MKARVVCSDWLSPFETHHAAFAMKCSAYESQKKEWREHHEIGHHSLGAWTIEEKVQSQVYQNLLHGVVRVAIHQLKLRRS